MRNTYEISAGLFEEIKAKLLDTRYNTIFFDGEENEIVINGLALVKRVGTTTDPNGDARIKVIVNAAAAAAAAEVNRQIVSGGSTHATLKARGLNMSTTKHDRVLTVNAALGAPDGPINQPYSSVEATPLRLILHCPRCRYQHVDDESFTETHRSHLCRACNTVWRPADVPSIGVRTIETRGKDDTWPPIQPQR